MKKISVSKAVRDYYRLTKPGIVRGNLVATAAGFFLAYKWHTSVWLLLWLLLGTALVIAGSCVLNNRIDREIDAKMARTRNRALVTGAISDRNAFVYAASLGIAGFICLLLGTNVLTALVGLTGMFFYVVVYGIAKRRSVYGTIIGSISGAVPPVAGYTAVTNHLDAASLLLFLLLVFWQMPHFYAIAMYRLSDYTAAGLPVWPVVRGMQSTKRQIISFMVLFALTFPLLYVFHYTGLTYLIIASALALVWLRLGLQGFRAVDDSRWARKVFGVSLLVLLGICIAIPLDSFIRNL